MGAALSSEVSDPYLHWLPNRSLYSDFFKTFSILLDGSSPQVELMGISLNPSSVGICMTLGRLLSLCLSFLICKKELLQ